ncbi:hypothetical protein AD428_00725 [Achromobacter sp. DMS1]|nr:hypothetical protein AD428_00725 [Achromobacter sp. DMS1]
MAQFKRRRRQLTRILRVYHKSSVFRVLSSPREDFARLVAFAVVVGMVGLSHLAVDSTPSTAFLIAFYGLVLLAGVVAHRVALHWSKRPWTYVSLLDNLLAQYDPIDVTAYQHLQDEARELGSVSRANVPGWLKIEIAHLDKQAPAKQAPAHFLDRQL